MKFIANSLLICFKDIVLFSLNIHGWPDDYNIPKYINFVNDNN